MKKILLSYIFPALGLGYASYSVLWTFAESAGLEAGTKTVVIIGIIAALSGTFYILVARLIALSIRVSNLKKALHEKQSIASYCCVKHQEIPVCPLGVTRIVDHTEDTIRNSLEAATRSFRWFGLSAFNVVHNNYDIFERKLDVNYSFMILSEKNSKLHHEVDKYFGDPRGKLNAKELINESEKLITRLSSDLNAKVDIIWHNQMPTFRIISIDNNLTYVSFYERGIDALKSFQLEFKQDSRVEYPLKNWFDAFLDKSKISEQVGKRKN